ncbi:MAG TPA: hypothetical protein VFI49_12700 [Rudaea sp.]|nr:hypothetical protein [Rudaea sp.]
MARKIASIVFLLTAIVIALGAFGHDSNAKRLAEEFARAPALDAGTVAIILAVWHFCSGCMFVLGAICVWSWWRIGKGARDAQFAPSLIGAFYIVSGLATVAYAGKPFFWLFVVLGALLLASTLVLRTAK